jgi:hypothetical protein
VLIKELETLGSIGQVDPLATLQQRASNHRAQVERDLVNKCRTVGHVAGKLERHAIATKIYDGCTIGPRTTVEQRDSSKELEEHFRVCFLLLKKEGFVFNQPQGKTLTTRLLQWGT